jgi:hypothetical protein
MNNKLGRVTSGNPHRKTSYVTLLSFEIKCFEFSLPFIVGGFWRNTTSYRSFFVGAPSTGKGSQDNVTRDLHDQNLGKALGRAAPPQYLLEADQRDG